MFCHIRTKGHGIFTCELDSVDTLTTIKEGLYKTYGIPIEEQELLRLDFVSIDREAKVKIPYHEWKYLIKS